MMAIGKYKVTYASEGCQEVAGTSLDWIEVVSFFVMINHEDRKSVV